MAGQFGEKSFDATPHRRQKAREQGQVARSQDLVSAITLLSALLALMFLGPPSLRYLQGVGEGHLHAEVALRMDQDHVTWLLRDTLLDVARVILPILGAVMLGGIAANLGQVGILLLPNKISVDFSRVSPAKGIQRLFSLNNLMKLLFGIFKILLVAATAGICVWLDWPHLANLSGYDLRDVVVFLYEVLIWTSLKCGIVLLILALIDFFYQRWKYEQDLKMTHQEIKEEMKSTQGDPQMIARRKQVQRQLAMQRLESAVPGADVVVTNPTELAIALKYDMDKMAAPIVVAKGAGLVAQKIRNLAMQNGVPVLERKPLARALYKEVDIGQPVPVELYAAVAEVLRYVYELKGKPLPEQRSA